MRYRAWSIKALWLAALTSGGTAQSTLLVGGTGPFTTIQDAIDAAAPGDIVLVEGPGMYGAFLLDKPLSIRSTGPARPWIIPTSSLRHATSPPQLPSSPTSNSAPTRSPPCPNHCGSPPSRSRSSSPNKPPAPTAARSSPSRSPAWPCYEVHGCGYRQSVYPEDCDSRHPSAG